MPKSKRRLNGKLKLKIVLEVLSGEKTPAQVARAYGVHPNSVVLWKKTLLERGPEVFELGERRSDDRRIAELEQLLGKKEVEIALLKNFLGRSE
jgi:transposase-like protein